MNSNFDSNFDSFEISREEILANFQAATNIEDIELAMAILNESDWDLQRAVNGFLSDSHPHHVEPNQCFKPETKPKNREINDDEEEIEFNYQPIREKRSEKNPFASLRDFSPPPATTAEENVGSSGMSSHQKGPQKSRRRMLNFEIEYRHQQIPITMEDSATVGDMKKQLSTMLKLAVKDMHLRFKHHVANDHTVLSSLHLPTNNQIFLLTPHLPTKSMIESQKDKQNSQDGENSNDRRNSMDAYENSFEIEIHDATQSDRIFTIKADATKSLSELKQDIYAVTNIPAHRQIWANWPEKEINNDQLLVTCEFLRPDEKFILIVDDRKTSDKPRPEKSKSHDSTINLSDEDMDASTEGFPTSSFSSPVHENHVTKNGHAVPLIPGDMFSMQEAAENFTRVFESRYGERHPPFYIGSLRDLVDHIGSLPAKERKPLLLYLHDDHSISANIFAQHVLCNEELVSYISQNFFTWAWDCTIPENRDRLYAMIGAYFGTPSANALQGTSVDEFPLLVVLHRDHGTFGVISVINGRHTGDEVLHQLFQVVEVFDLANADEIAEEAQRHARETMRNEQEAAYQESLLQDRQREEERRKTEAQAEAAEAKLRQAAADRQALQDKIAADVPEEPPANSADVRTFRIRFPTGEMKERRFAGRDRIKDLVNYLWGQGYPPNEFRVMNQFPKEDLTANDPQKTFSDLKMAQKMALVVEKREI